MSGHDYSRHSSSSSVSSSAAAVELIQEHKLMLIAALAGWGFEVVDVATHEEELARC